MEEWLFRHVVFVGGPSEIKYWAELKDVFELFDVEMPIVMPRLRITYLNDRIKITFEEQYSIRKSVSRWC